MSASSPERVFPPASGGSSPAPGGRRAMPRLSQRQQLAAAGAVAVVGLALYTRSKSGGGDVTGAADNPSSVYELDTRDTDLYNELQPELERVSDALDELKDGLPTLPAAGPKPTPPKPGPKPGNPAFTEYMVKKGDTLNAIAKRFGIGRQRLYDNNKARIEATARSHGLKSSMNGRRIFPGTVLRVPVKPKG